MLGKEDTLRSPLPHESAVRDLSHNARTMYKVYELLRAADEICCFLAELSLEQYLASFVANELLLDDAVDLTNDELADMGIVIKGHQLRLRKALRKRADDAAAAAAAAATSLTASRAGKVRAKRNAAKRKRNANLELPELHKSKLQKALEVKISDS